MELDYDSRYPRIDDLRERARRRIPRFAFEYLDGGCNDDVNLYRNTSDIRDVELIPQYLAEHRGSSDGQRNSLRPRRRQNHGLWCEVHVSGTSVHVRRCCVGEPRRLAHDCHPEKAAPTGDGTALLPEHGRLCGQSARQSHLNTRNKLRESCLRTTSEINSSQLSTEISQ